MHTGFKCFQSLLKVNICSMTVRRWKRGVTLPRLPYNYDALEPVLCKELIKLLHKQHHKHYIDNLNAALKKLKEALRSKNINGIVALEKTILFNGGGHINYSLLYNNYSPQSSQVDGELLQLINSTFGSVECLKKKLIIAANSVQGNGWAWLAHNRETGCLVVTTTIDHNPLQPTTGLFPILGINVWEHAYYLQYLNKRRDYVKTLLDVINWENVRHRYLDAKCGIVS